MKNSIIRKIANWIVVIILFISNSSSKAQFEDDTLKPSPRFQLSMIFDNHKNRVVLFGGSSDGKYLGDMWQLDGNRWKLIGQFDQVRRVVHAMAYDEKRKTIILYGGLQDGKRIGDTWEFIGNSWKQISTKEIPPFDAHQMIFFSGTDEVILFGGIDSNKVNNKNTYAYNGKKWRIVDSTGPSARFHHVMVYDSNRRKIVLFGGNTVDLLKKPTIQDLVKAQKGDTWEWDGKSWTEVKVDGPSPRDHQGMAYDSDRKVVVLFGGFNGEYLGDTWEYDGMQWKKIDVEGPPVRGGKPGMVYDKARKKVVLFGGGIGGGTKLTPKAMNDTWEWDGKTWKEIQY